MVDIIEKKKNQLIELCRNFRVKRLELFGSAAGDDFDSERSDFDFLVEFVPLSPSEHAACYFGFLAALRDMFSRKVDLVEIRAIRNPYFKEHVELSRIKLYGT